MADAASPSGPYAEPRWTVALRNQLNVLPAIFFREAESRNGRRFAMGYLAAGIEPLTIAVVLAVLFSVLARNPPYGRSIMLFLGTGVFPIYLFFHTAVRMRAPLGAGRHRLRDPLERPLDHIVVLGLLHFVISMMVAVLFFAGLYAVGIKAALPENPIIAFEALSTIFLLGMAMGIVNSVVVRMLPIWDLIWPAIARTALHLSGLFYVVAFMPPKIRWYFELNPLLHGTNWFRHAFYPFYPQIASSSTYVLATAFGLLTFGLLLEAGTRHYLEGTE